MPGTFLGEIELGEGADANLSDFQTLPNIQKINSTAQQYQGRVEIMPYQKQGEEVKLLVSVYLEQVEVRGKIIAVLIREPYPNDLGGLKILLERAKSRAVTLRTLTSHKSVSIDEAEADLQEIINRLP